MTETKIIRTCGHNNHSYKLIHKNNKLFEELTILVCSSCVDKTPFNKLTREPIIDNE